MVRTADNGSTISSRPWESLIFGMQWGITKAVWSKKNVQGLGLIQATVSNVIWQKHQSLPTAKEVLDALETKFGAAGGAQTYLQLVNMVKLQFTDSTDLLPQIQQFQDNYNLIMSNGHSRLSKDLTTFMFCSSLLDSYESTARQYLDNITAIANYKLLDIIARVLQEENRWKAMALRQGSSLNKFSMTRNLGQQCAKCGKTNHTMQNHWPRGRIWIKKAKDNQSPKHYQIHLEKRRQTKRGRAKKRHQWVPMYYLYQNWPTCLYKWHNQLNFHAMRWGRKWDGAWIVDAQIISHQARAILSSTGN